MMAHETIVRGVVVAMALDAEAHCELLRQDDAIHGFDVPVARAAVDAGFRCMLVNEMSEVRQIGDPHPPDRLVRA